jgi:hypothetical protein
MEELGFIRMDFMALTTTVFFENLSIKIQVSLNLARITGTLREDQYQFMILYRSVPPRMKNVPG